MKHLLELADLVAYENRDNSNGEHVPPTYIGRHKSMLTKEELPDVLLPSEPLSGSHKHFFKDGHGVVHETCIMDADCTGKG